MEETQKYRNILANWTTPFTKTTDEAWAELAPKLSTEARVVSGVFNWRKSLTWASAAVAIFLAVLFWPAAPVMQEITALQHEKVVLPDQSVLYLNAGSTARFAQKWDDGREVELSGQGFFEVQPGSSFVVKTTQGQVEVLGTSFDVYTRAQDFRVACYTGKVRVKADAHAEEITTGQMAAWLDNQWKISDFDVQRADWRSGEFYFTNEPLANVFNEIARQFNVTIETPGLPERMFTGRFSNKNLNQALETVCLPMQLSYQIKGNVVVVQDQ
ncbi:MAG TPA: FecR domain-containing protein [Flavobacteriales bacterium]